MATTPTEDPWPSDEELKKILQVEPMTGAEMIRAGVTGGWEHLAITDSQAWLDQKRRERSEQLKW